MFGEEPKMSTYFITRSGKGTSIERRKVYKYQSLAAGFMNRHADPFIVTVEPKMMTNRCNRTAITDKNLILYLKVVCFLYRGKELILK